MTASPVLAVLSGSSTDRAPEWVPVAQTGTLWRDAGGSVYPASTGVFFGRSWQFYRVFFASPVLRIEVTARHDSQRAADVSVTGVQGGILNDFPAGATVTVPYRLISPNSTIQFFAPAAAGRFTVLSVTGETLI